jgi:glucose/arabinose dehydrogenase
MSIRAPRTVLVVATAVASVAATLTGATPGLAAKSSSITVHTVISGLNAPRGIAFDGAGNLYVAQSGRAGSGAAGLTHSGRVTKYVKNTSATSWSKRFESVYASEDPSAPPDVLGPEGLTAVTDGCRQVSRRECQVRLIMSESHRGVAKMSGGAISTKQIGHLFRLNPGTGRRTELSNVGDRSFGWTNRHKALFPDDFPDSNPFGVLAYRDTAKNRVRTFVADAGANTIIEVMPRGRTRVVSYIPNEKAPPFRDSTPTCIARGPDGMLYVATLNLVANLFVPGATGGKSEVWKVNPNAKYPTKPKLWATGLTTPTGCTFDKFGNFWAAEMFGPNASGPPGDLVAIPFKHPGQQLHLGAGKIVLPGMLAFGPGGALYVTTHSSDPAKNSGKVVRVVIHY